MQGAGGGAMRREFPTHWAPLGDRASRAYLAAMPMTLLTAWQDARDALKAAGVASPVNDARALLEAAANVARIDILTDPHRVLDDAVAARLLALVQRRAAREPLGYILGRLGFWKIDLAVRPGVLNPRHDTESLVDAALKLIEGEPAPKILDLGVGSGAILFALLHERPQASGVGLDISPAALEIAAENQARLGLEGRVQLLSGDWFAGLEASLLQGGFDLVVANPPYIKTAVIPTLEPEVAAHEPHLALDGGPDGLAAYRALAPQILACLKPGGGFVLEIGQGQGPAVSALMAQAGLIVHAIRPDLSGIGRALVGQKPKS
jgi:release factor glutamine methyltransferase